METKYRVLHFIGGIYKVLGVLVGILTMLFVAAVCLFSVLGLGSSGSSSQSYNWLVPYVGSWGVIGGLISAFFTLIGMGGAALALFAFGEGIDLLIDMEKNTRLSNRLLERLIPPDQPAP